MSRLQKFVAVGLILTCGVVDAGPVAAGTATRTFRVRLRVLAGCTISASPINFATTASTSASAPANVTGGGTVTCTTGTPYDYTMTSAHGGAMVNGATRISYRIMEGARQVNGTVPGVLSNTGTGAAQAINLSWQITGWSVNLPVGTYSDTVTLTVNW